MPKVMINMEMPKSCWDCPLQIGSNMDEVCSYTRFSTWKNHKERNEYCPLKEIK